MSNLGALTTTFTQPATCRTTSVYSNYYSVVGLDIGFVGPNLLLSSAPSCFPPGFTSNASQELYFSPGIACPSGWATAGLNIGSTSGTDESETAAICCPSSLFPGSYTYLDYSLPFGCTSRPSAFSAGLPVLYYANSIEVRWRSSDLVTTAAPGISSHSATASPAPSTTSIPWTTALYSSTLSTASPSSIESQAASSTSPRSEVSVSTAAAIVIGVGAGLFVIAGLFSMALCLRSRYSRRRQIEKDGGHSDTEGGVEDGKQDGGRTGI